MILSWTDATGQEAWLPDADGCPGRVLRGWLHPGPDGDTTALTPDGRAHLVRVAPGPAPEAQPLHTVFVYGTLMRGEALHGHMAGARGPVPATVPGTLLRLGWYPGLVLEPRNTVHGELYQVDAHIIRRLDEVEDFVGFDHHGSLYERRIVMTGHGAQAWIYVLLRRPASATVIPSGSWRS